MIHYKKDFVTVTHNKSNKILTYKLALHYWGDMANSNILFCVHGLARNARDFDYIAQVLAEKYLVIAIDIVGRGDSDWVDDKSHYSYENYIEDIIQIIKILKITKLNWLGTSMGGIIGMAIAARFPGLIDKIILNDIGTLILKSSLQRIARYVSMIPEFDNFDVAKEYFKMILVNFGIKEEEHWDHIVKHSIKLNDRGKLLLSYDPGIALAFKGVNPDDIQDVNLRKEWEWVSFKKMLIIHGEKSDILLNDDLKFMQNSKQNIQTLVLKDVGHAPALVNDYEIEPIKHFFFT